MGRITVNNGSQTIVVEDGRSSGRLGDRPAMTLPGRLALLVLTALVRALNVVLWGTLGVIVGFFWALLRKRS